MKKQWPVSLCLWALIPWIVFTMACSDSTGSNDEDDDTPEVESANNFPQAEVEN